MTDVLELLREGNTIQINPQGTSMYPLFVEESDAAVIVPVDKLGRKIKKLDVCLYRGTSGSLVLHRVYGIDENSFFFVGDHQTVIEGPIEAGQIYGVMISYIRRGHAHSISSPFYVFYSATWMMLRRFRLKLIGAGSRVKRLLKGR